VGESFKLSRCTGKTEIQLVWSEEGNYHLDELELVLIDAQLLWKQRLLELVKRSVLLITVRTILYCSPVSPTSVLLLSVSSALDLIPRKSFMEYHFYSSMPEGRECFCS
jgi:hypothetical protein